MSAQAQVFRKIKSATKLLHQARELEHSIEEERIARMREGMKRGDHAPSEYSWQHDPLGGQLEVVIEKLEDLS